MRMHEPQSNSDTLDAGTALLILASLSFLVMCARAGMSSWPPTEVVVLLAVMYFVGGILRMSEVGY